MAYNSQTARRTGRTTRMLDKAIAYAKLGRYVLVQAPCQENVQWLYNFLCERKSVEPTMEPVGSDKVYIGTGSISIVYDPHVFSKQRNKPHRGVIELVDPSYVEYHFGRLLETLHAFDLPAGESLKSDWKWQEIDPERVLSSEEINSCIKGVTGSYG